MLKVRYNLNRIRKKGKIFYYLEIIKSKSKYNRLRMNIGIFTNEHPAKQTLHSL